MSESVYFVHVPALGEASLISLTSSPDMARIAELLHTDVTERLCVAEADAGERVLCYWIDARGGDRGLPVNFCGTCLYHTGCPIFGDLLLGYAGRNSAEESAFGMPKAAAEELLLEMRALRENHMGNA